MTTPQRTVTVMASLIAFSVVVEGVLLFLLVGKMNPAPPVREEVKVPTEDYSPALVQPAAPPQTKPSAGAVIIAGLVITPLMVLIAVPILALYFLPTIIAFWRGHQSWMAIALLNFLSGSCLGLSCFGMGPLGVGWILALIWSLSGVWSNEHHHYHYPAPR
jgi:hypothetical protein